MIPGAADRNLLHQAYRASEDVLVERAMLEDKIKATGNLFLSKINKFFYLLIQWGGFWCSVAQVKVVKTSRRLPKTPHTTQRRWLAVRCWKYREQKRKERGRNI